jgi:DNA primase
MGKISQSSTKYVIRAELESSGIIEKPDIVGAIFGQTEGLLGDELDLRELQEKGRVGRIDVNVEEKDGSSQAEIEIPTSLDSTETALLAASLETIERVGPTGADIRVKNIDDRRNTKRDYIVKRAKQLLSEMQDDKPEKNSITREVKEEVRTSEITEYRGFSAGPSAEESEEIIFVEGKADLLNLLKNGVKNTVALGGTSIPENAEKIAEEKTLTAFLDGDRGGDLILRELGEKAEPDYVARAPEDKEVEELGKEQIYRALRDKERFKYAGNGEKEELGDEKIERFSDILDELVGTRAVFVLDEELEIVDRFPLQKTDKLRENENCKAVALDGEIGKQITEKAEKAGSDYLIGMKKTGSVNSSKLRIITRKDLPEKVS